ncbi:hypothetical protein [Acidovorax sp. CF316]|uniref:hypothetical protein n=1 Tax=Acidovorax sp. CF316 TaxID=1144317 RepID=UPI0011B28DA5|nr:hypothetical protein [Acidovorax sp. CF316]
MTAVNAPQKHQHPIQAKQQKNPKQINCVGFPFFGVNGGIRTLTRHIPAHPSKPPKGGFMNYMPLTGNFNVLY